ncbi:hypothetical protein ACIB24_12515 [Spongisporangium articulatum]|uniref:Uncharacterized protein n=1 Tax=Spongisporangium articulatum TaxID=3362603 RepID=A0ABW8APM8_9ACTN
MDEPTPIGPLVEFLTAAALERAKLRDQIIDGDPNHPVQRQILHWATERVERAREALLAVGYPAASVDQLIRDADPRTSTADTAEDVDTEGQLPDFTDWVEQEAERNTATVTPLRRPTPSTDPMEEPHGQ